MTIAEGGLHDNTLHAHDMHHFIHSGNRCIAESAQHSGIFSVETTSQGGWRVG